MKSPEYIAHGTASEKDAEKIKNEEFKALEGRATVSGDLIEAFEFATKIERRDGVQSESPIAEGEIGRIIIMKVPEDKSVDYATHTNIEVDETAKEITGYSSKYVSGRKQLAIYDGRDISKKIEKIEKAKKEFNEIKSKISSFYKENRVKSKEDLIEAIKSFDIEKKIEILKKAKELERQYTEKEKLAKPNIAISKENILMSIIPTKELGEKLGELSQGIREYGKVDFKKFTEELSKIIENNKENFLTSDLDVREVVRNLLTSTVETEVVNMIRSLSMDIKRAQGYEIYNREKDEVKEKAVDKEKLKQKIEKMLSVVEAKNFDIGMENLNRYIKMNIKKLSSEAMKI